MPMAALRLPCRTCVLSASPRLALDIFQARLARKAWAGDFGRDIFCRFAYEAGKLHGSSLDGSLRSERTWANHYPVHHVRVPPEAKHRHRLAVVPRILYPTEGLVRLAPEPIERDDRFACTSPHRTLHQCSFRLLHRLQKVKYLLHSVHFHLHSELNALTRYQCVPKKNHKTLISVKISSSPSHKSWSYFSPFALGYLSFYTHESAL